MTKKKTHTKRRLLIIFLIIISMSLICIGMYYFKSIHNKIDENKIKKSFPIKVENIKNDNNKNGIDDHKDMMLGARAYIKTKPVYKSEYYDGGYPPSGEGVCTDVIWKAFESAGYSLKDMVDTDISEHRDAYPNIKVQDKNIDFRRVENLKIFFDRNATVLTTDLSKPNEWQEGDIVVYTNHIAMCSDKRNSKGMPYIIHHNQYGAREINSIYKGVIVGHYRWK